MDQLSVNPATGEIVARTPTHAPAEVESRLAATARAYGDWSPRARLPDRIATLRRAADILDRDRAALARLATLEMGKPIAQAEAEVEKSALGCRHYADHAERILADVDIPTGRKRSFIRWLPLGPILAVMPWNFPYWQVFRFAAPALAAGNVGLLKHASNVPQCARAIESVFREAGAPDGVFSTLLIGSDRVADLIADARIRGVTLTGSEAAGAKVAAQAGAALKKTVLELGGSDPFIVMPSADLDAVLATAVRARVQNAGQSCIAAKRFIVHADVYDAFLDRFSASMRALKVGDPMDRTNDLGPLATRQIRDDIDDQVRRSLAAGARCFLGGAPIAGPGWFYPPTVLTDIAEAAPAHSEELFGPVASVFRISSIEQAIALANATRFGLGSSVWTRDAAEQARFVDEIEAGFTAINAMVSSDPRLPFGGVKASGYGRELSDIGLQEFLNAKTVVES